MKKILITGCAGFIGFHLCKSLLKKKKIIIGIDNINNYYSVKLKTHRLKILSEYKNFFFKKINIENKDSLDKILKKNKINTIVNLAAQAGVAYSMKKPEKYFKSNIQGFFNICDLAKKYKIKKIIYASSSSVYGDNKKLPVKENYKTNPLNYYAITKENNEKTANYFSNICSTKFVGLRFFSIYGPLGRPDMLIYKILNCFENKKIFFLNNNGNHKRDFTYIDDAVSIVTKLINKKLKSNNNIFNICNSRMVKLTHLIKLMRKKNINPIIKSRGFQNGDIKNASGSNSRIKKLLKNLHFTSFEIGLNKTIDYYYSIKN
jgi:UDP-glucuronate 4-epimerase